MDKSIRQDKLTLGTCYYPEHWEERSWQGDLQSMKAHGINTIRVFEFAWTIVEPDEGTFDFSLFDKFLNLAAAEKMRVILCTPTATPPAWLTSRYPETLNVRMDGQQIHHGHRRQYNYNAEKYVFFAQRIAEKLAQRYGRHPAVVGWQIDNEVNCEIDEFYSDADRSAFRAYLKTRFGTLDALNRAIGATFWNQTYTDWSQVDMERPTVPMHGNPHMALLEKQFFSLSANRFVKLQADTLRAHSPGRFITTNGLFRHVDYVEMTQNALDFITYDSYPNFSNIIGGDSSWAVMGDRKWSRNLSVARELSPNFGVMEQQSGANGWDFNMLSPMPRPGQIRLWTYQSIANGADFVSYFRWRTCTFGTELYWHGINDYSGKENRRLREVGRIANELERLHAIAGSRYEAKIALATDDLNEWDGERDQWHGKLSRASQEAIFEAAQRSHTPIDTLHLRDDTDLSALSRYKALFYPHPTILTKERAALLTAYAQNGGKLFLGARTGYKDEFGRCYQTPMPCYAAELCGVTVTDYTFAHPKEEPVTIQYHGQTLDAPIFHDMLEATRDGEVLGTFVGSYYHGQPAVVRRTYEHGGYACYVGSGFSVSMTRALLADAGVISPYASVIECDASCELALRRRNDERYFFILNYMPTETSYTLHAEMTDLLSGQRAAGPRSLEGYGVAVYQA